MNEPVLIRSATANDEPRLMRLAALDSAVHLRGAALVAEVAGELRAAVEVDTGRVIADPFKHSAQIAELLGLRAGHHGSESLTSANARRRHDSPHRGTLGRRAGWEDDRAGARAGSALAAARPGC